MNTKKLALLLNRYGTGTHTLAIYNKKLTHKFLLMKIFEKPCLLMKIFGNTIWSWKYLETLPGHKNMWKPCVVMKIFENPAWSWKYLETLLGHENIWKPCLVMKIFGNPTLSWKCLKLLLGHENIWKPCLVMKIFGNTVWSWKYLETLPGHENIWKPCLVMKIFGHPAWSWKYLETLRGHEPCLVMKIFRIPAWSCRRRQADSMLPARMWSMASELLFVQWVVGGTPLHRKKDVYKALAADKQTDVILQRRYAKIYSFQTPPFYIPS